MQASLLSQETGSGFIHPHNLLRGLDRPRFLFLKDQYEP
jgi:hypothetical protein